MKFKQTCLLLFHLGFLRVQAFNNHSPLRAAPGLSPARTQNIKHEASSFSHHHGSSTSLSVSPEQELAIISSEAASPFIGFLKSPELWTALLMSSIILLLYIWEEGEKVVRKSLPETLRPIVDSMLGEMGALGFIGLFLGIVVIHGPLGGVVDTVSKEFFDDRHLLLELFENLHDEFFVAAISFFIVNGVTVWRTLVKIETIEEVSSAVFDIDGDGDVGLDELASFLKVESIVVDADGDGNLDDDEIKEALRNAKPPSIWQEVFASPDRIRAEALVVRERFIQTCRVGPSFCIEEYFIPIFGHNLEEFVELAPWAYFLLVPWVALSQAVDIPNHIVSPTSPNIAASCGQFLSTPSFFWVSAVSSVLIFAWGAWNFLKITQIKEMLAPTLVRDSMTAGGEVLLPPRYEDEEFLKSHEERASPNIVGLIESIWAKPANNNHERLFGVAGSAGPDLYRNSIKYHTWLVTAQIVFWGPQIVLRDAQALMNGWQVGNPALLVPELEIFSVFLGMAVLQLLFAPQAFLTYCLVTSIEQLADESMVQEECLVTGIYDETAADAKFSRMSDKSDEASDPTPAAEPIAEPFMAGGEEREATGRSFLRRLVGRGSKQVN